MSETRFLPGWDEERVRKVLTRYEKQTEEETVAEDEATLEDPDQAVMEVLSDLGPKIREMIARYRAKA